MKHTTQYQNAQANFEELVKGLVKIKALPANIIIYMYYAPRQSAKAECFSYTSREAEIYAYLKNKVSGQAIKNFREGKNVTFSAMAIATFAGTIENHTLVPLPAEDLDAISLLVGGIVLNLEQPVYTGNSTKEVVEKYAVGLQIINLGTNIKEFRRVYGYGV